MLEPTEQRKRGRETRGSRQQLQRQEAQTAAGSDQWSQVTDPRAYTEEMRLRDMLPLPAKARVGDKNQQLLIICRARQSLEVLYHLVNPHNIPLR